MDIPRATGERKGMVRQSEDPKSVKKDGMRCLLALRRRKFWHEKHLRRKK